MRKWSGKIEGLHFTAKLATSRAKSESKEWREREREQEQNE